jgi:hypothetical protein
VIEGRSDGGKEGRREGGKELWRERRGSQNDEIAKIFVFYPLIIRVILESI